MGMLDDFLKSIGFGPKETRTREEILEDLKKQAEEAEQLAKQTEEAAGYKKRIAAAQAARQKTIQQAGGGKKGLSKGQLIFFGILALVFLILVIRSCG